MIFFLDGDKGTITPTGYLIFNILSNIMKLNSNEVEIKAMEDLIYELGSSIKSMLADALLNHYSIERVCIELKETLRAFRKEHGLIPKKLIP